MILTNTERDRRWAAAREVMQERDVDVLLAHSNLGDVPAAQRWLSGMRSIFDDVCVVLFRDEGTELILSHAGGQALAAQLSWIPKPSVATTAAPWLVGGDVAETKLAAPSVGRQAANLILERGFSKIGIAGLELFPSGWKDEIAAGVPGATFVDLNDEILALRLAKSDEEVALTREACRIADVVWEQMPEVLKPGRRVYEALADLERLVRLHGAEDTYNLVTPLPFLAEPFDAWPETSKIIGENSAFNVEVSPKYHGYWGQLTGLVTIGKYDPTMTEAVEAINRARDAGVAVMKAGVDILDVVTAVADHLSADGYELASPLMGHFAGLTLEDLRPGGKSLILESGMTFIFHPFAKGFPAVMRADTYLIGEDGAERLTKYPVEVLHL